MQYVISIFVLGLMVTFLVAKGIVQAQEFARTEWERQRAEVNGKEASFTAK